MLDRFDGFALASISILINSTHTAAAGDTKILVWKKPGAECS